MEPSDPKHGQNIHFDLSHQIPVMKPLPVLPLTSRLGTPILLLPLLAPAQALPIDNDVSPLL
jgi:hypothetical protein